MTRKHLPERGQPHTEVLAELDAMASGDADWRGARTWSLVYHAGDEHARFLKEAYGRFFSENGLNPMAFRSLKRLETEVVQMAAGLMRGGPATVGLMTAGGTESILLAMKAYRDRARRRLRLPGRPVVIAPESVHIAFEKAAAYFDLKLQRAPLRDDFRVDVKAVRRMLSPRCILVVGSAPCYPYGVVDGIEELSALCQTKGVPLHVDACLGGFLLPFLEQLGEPIPPWDFRLPGVSSISADVHKYGYAAKGASVLLYRDMELMRHQFFAYTDWCGGVFASAGLLGTRPGGAYAAAWAAMQALGEDGYLGLHGKALETTRRLMAGIDGIPELEVLGRPDATIFAYRSRDPEVNIYAVGDRLAARGWHVDRQQHPACLHAMVTQAHAGVVDAYLADLRAAVAEVKGRPELSTQGDAAMYGLVAHVPLRGMVKKNVLKMMEAMYGPEGAPPDLGAEAGKPGDRLTALALKALPRLEKLSGLLRRLRRR
jgi:glutamate/tyrosine decarboxylase-like PLP-dependent enzyme